MREGPLTWATEPGKREGTILLRLFGPWTMENSAAFEQEFLLMRPAVLIVEMSGVPYVDSAGVGILMQAHVSAQNAGRVFALASVTDHVMALLYLIRANLVLKMYRTVGEAEAAVLRRERR